MEARIEEADAGRPKLAPRIEMVGPVAAPQAEAKQRAPRSRRVIALVALAAAASMSAGSSSARSCPLRTVWFSAT